MYSTNLIILKHKKSFYYYPPSLQFFVPTQLFEKFGQLTSEYF